MRREYPDRPIPGVGAVLIEDDKALLVKRAHEPGKGLWAIPGGVVEVGETVESAAIREVKEETGFDTQIKKLLGVTDIIIEDKDNKVQFHYVLTSFLAEIIGGKLENAPDRADVIWFTQDQINKLKVTAAALKLLQKICFIKFLK